MEMGPDLCRDVQLQELQIQIPINFGMVIGDNLYMIYIYDVIVDETSLSKVIIHKDC